MRKHILAGLMIGWGATTAYGFIAPKQSPNGVEVKSSIIRPSTYRSDVATFSAEKATVGLDRQSNSIRKMTGKLLLGVQVKDFSKKAFEDAALKAVAARPDVFGVSSSDVRINAKATHVDPEDQSVSLVVYRDGLPIQDAGITMRFKFGHLTSLKSETFAEATVADGYVTNTAEIAMKALNSAGYVANGSKWRVMPTNAGYSLVKIDEFVVSGADAPWVVQVRRTDGQLHDVRSKHFHLQGKAFASAYPRHFEETIKELPLPNATITNARARSNSNGEFTSTDEFSAPTMTSLSGQYVQVNNTSGTEISATATKENNEWAMRFNVPATEVLWDNPKMAQTMTYLSVNRIIATAKQFIAPEWFNQPLRANVNRSQKCNASWDGLTINFYSAGDYAGTTCANTALIADVVYHEWGHGLDDNTGGIEDGALSEGFGDAMSTLFTNDASIGPNFLPIERRAVRDLSVVKKYPDDLVDEEHADGVIFGGAMWSLYNGLKAKLDAESARQLYAKFLFKGIYQYAKMTDAYDAIVTLDDNDTNLENGTPNLCVINTAFVKHGLATEDARCTKI